VLITFKNSVDTRDIKAVETLLSSWGVYPYTFSLKDKTIIGCSANLIEERIAMLQSLCGVENITPFSVPYKMASLEFKKEKTVIEKEGVCIGGNAIVLMAGPCAIESVEQLSCIASEVHKSGAKVLRGCAFKGRSSPYTFQGLGTAALKIHKELQKQHGMLIETEVMDVRDVALVADYVDIVRIGARSMQNFPLLKEVGMCCKPVILKRGPSATVEEWLMSAEYIMTSGNPEVILCERGIRTFETATRYTLDLSGVALVKELSHLPVIVDPSHAAGRTDLIAPLSKAAIALGADGLLIEVHHAPKQARCDGMQALVPDAFATLVEELRPIAKSIGRSL